MGKKDYQRHCLFFIFVDNSTRNDRRISGSAVKIYGSMGKEKKRKYTIYIIYKAGDTVSGVARIPRPRAF